MTGISKTHEKWIDRASTEEHGWIKVKEPKPYDVILMSLGATHVTNHCSNIFRIIIKYLQTMINHNSWVTNMEDITSNTRQGYLDGKNLIN